MNNDPSSDTSNPAAGSLHEGQKLAGCYILKSKVASSDVAEVWLAQDEVLGKDVTLHFAPEAVMRDPRAVAELRSEVKRNRQLIHPSILRVYDFVEDGSCTAVSMDKFDGESLGSLLRARGCFEPADLFPWLKELAETLDDAHRVQLIHRDLSPDNLYVRPSGGILVKGFGVSRAIRDAMERAGLAKGEAAHVAYMSPQLIDGERPTAADDVYGFGVLIFELVTGTLPFTGDSIVPQIRKTVPPTMSAARAAAGKSGEVPASWQDAVAACLAKGADQRPRNCAEAVKRLSEEKRSVAASVPATPEKSAMTAAQRAVEPSRSVEAGATVTGTAETRGSVDSPKASLETAPVGANSDDGGKGVNLVPPPPPASKKPPVKRSLSANYPDLDRPKSKAPLIALGLAAVALGFAVVSKLIGEPEVPEDSGIEPIIPTLPVSDENSVAVTDPPLQEPEPVDLGPGDPPSAVLPDAGTAPDGSLIGVAANIPPADGATGQEPEPSVVPPSEQGVPVVGKGRIISETENVAAEPKKEGDPIVAEPPPKQVEPAAVAMKLPVIPEMPPKLVLDKAATEEELDQLLIERKAIYDKFNSIAKVIEFANEENTALQTRKRAEMEELGKALGEKRKVLSPVIQAAATVETERKKLDEAQAKAEAAAVEAQKTAEAAKKAYADLVASAAEKLKMKDAAEAELREMDAKIVAAKQVQGEVGEAVNAGTAELQQVKLLIQRAEDEQKILTAAHEKARAATSAKMLAVNKAKIAGIEEQAKVIEAQRARYAAALPALKELPEMADSVKKMELKIGEADVSLKALREEIEALSGKNLKAPKRPADSAPPLPVDDAKKPIGANVPPSDIPATPEPSAANSVGMEFLKVGDVMFSRNVTTRGQFEAFSKAVGLKPERWRSPGFEQGPDHPVVNVSWREADEFCKWLTAKDRKEGLIGASEVYRLPTDLEWSKAVGLPAESGQTPEDRDVQIENIYPWGTQWPPPAGVGNFAGEETETELPIRGFNDGFPNTSPAGSFKANAAGLYDMSGNVWQWVADDWNKDGREKTLRGGSWYNGAIRMSLLSSCRIMSSPDTIHDTYGFRVVKAPSRGNRK